MSQILETAKQAHCDGDADASQGFSERLLLRNQELQADNNNQLYVQRSLTVARNNNNNNNICVKSEEKEK